MAALRDADLVEWATRSAEKLREGSQLGPDEREQIAEELWFMAGSASGAKESHGNLARPSVEERVSAGEADRQLGFDDSAAARRDSRGAGRVPSLWPLLERELSNLYARARKDSEVETGVTAFPERNPFTLEQILRG